MQGLESTAIDFVRSLFDTLGWAGVVLAMVIESACIPLPSEVIMPLAGWMLVAEHHLGWQGILLASFWGAIGNLIGSTIAYAVGAWGGRPLIERYGRYILITRKDLNRADEWFSKRGEITTFVSRLLPVIRTFISFPAGVARMNYVRFATFSFAGAFLWCIPLTIIGYQLGPKWDDFRQKARFLDYPIVAIVLALIAWYVWHKVGELREEARQDAEAEEQHQTLSTPK
jgi:membrane protein DedA with SNARE-associated domain